VYVTELLQVWAWEVVGVAVSLLVMVLSDAVRVPEEVGLVRVPVPSFVRVGEYDCVSDSVTLKD